MHRWSSTFRSSKIIDTKKKKKKGTFTVIESFIDAVVINAMCFEVLFTPSLENTCLTEISAGVTVSDDEELR